MIRPLRLTFLITAEDPEKGNGQFIVPTLATRRSAAGAKLPIIYFEQAKPVPECIDTIITTMRALEIKNNGKICRSIMVDATEVDGDNNQQQIKLILR